MKVKIIKGTLRKDGKEYSASESVDIDDKEAEGLIALGMARKVGTDKDVVDKDDGNAANVAKEKRKALEEKAVKLEIGTEDEVKVLSDADLEKQISNAQAVKKRQALIKKALEKNLGTEDEIAKLSDADLEDLLKNGGSK